MSSNRAKKLRRLAKTISVLHRMEARELARVNAACIEIREREAGVHAFLDTDLAGAEFLAELAIASAARLRENLVEAEAQLEGQRELTANAKAKAERAQRRVEALVELSTQASAARKLDEVIEAIVQNRSVSGKDCVIHNGQDT